MRENEFAISRKKSKLLLHMFAGLFLTAGSAFVTLFNYRSIPASSFLHFAAEHTWISVLFRLIGVLGILFFGLLFTKNRKRYLNAQPIMTFNRRGITDLSNDLSVGFIPWEDVSAVYFSGTVKNRFLEIGLHDPEKYLSKIGTYKSQMIRANMKLGHEAICLSLSGTDCLPDAALSRIEALYNKRKK